MRRRMRALLELTAHLVRDQELFLRSVPLHEEYERHLVEIDARTIDPSFVWSDLYVLRVSTEVLRCTPGGLLPPGLDAGREDPLVDCAFAVWSRKERREGETVDEILEAMQRHIVADLHRRPHEGIGSRRFAALGRELERRTGGRTLIHTGTLPCADVLISMYADADSLERVVRLVD